MYKSLVNLKFYASLTENCSININVFLLTTATIIVFLRHNSNVNNQLKI